MPRKNTLTGNSERKRKRDYREEKKKQQQQANLTPQSSDTETSNSSFVDSLSNSSNLSESSNPNPIPALLVPEDYTEEERQALCSALSQVNTARATPPYLVQSSSPGTKRKAQQVPQPDVVLESPPVMLILLFLHFLLL